MTMPGQLTGPERAGAWHALVVARNAAFLAGDTELAQDDDAGQHLPVPAALDSMRRVRRFLGEYAIPTSVWFRDALRAGVALAAAVLLARSLGVDHAFWVALGTLSVLRSSALGTGQTAVAASLGTGIGFAVSSAVLAVIGLHRRRCRSGGNSFHDLGRQAEAHVLWHDLNFPQIVVSLLAKELDHFFHQALRG